jgi:type 1 glutamine amidotransferase
MKRIVAVLGDYYHPQKYSKAALDQALVLLNEKEKIDCVEIQISQLKEELEKQPDAVLLFKEDRLNPTDEKVDTWMTEEIGQAITQYVNNGGGWLAWHSGLASYSIESTYVQMVKGHFEYHPVNHPQVKYTDVRGDHPFGSISFEIKDEHYFVTVNEKDTNVFLESDSEEGHSIAGWYHDYGNGRVCSLVPAHNEEGLLHSDFTQLLAKTIEWVSE